MNTMDDGSHALPSSKPVPVASYQRRVPSPPYIPVVTSGPKDRYSLTPIYTKVADRSIATPDQYDIITGGAPAVQVAVDRSGTWNYEHRRSAQRILDWLWIGPTSVVKDADFLRREAFTLVIAARSARLAGMRMGHLDKAAEDFGFAVAHMAVVDPQELLKSMPDHVGLINNHILNVHYQAQSHHNNGHASEDRDPPKTGKILLTCDTGNDLAGTISTAYVMAMFGANMGKAIQFVSVQRFCCVFSEEYKRLLQTWGELLQARRGVARSAAKLYAADRHHQQQPREEEDASASSKRSKRRVEELMDIDDDPCPTPDQDEDRFAGRDAFVPFMDLQDDVR